MQAIILNKQELELLLNAVAYLRDYRGSLLTDDLLESVWDRLFRLYCIEKKEADNGI
jgi:hypothetical protein